MLVNANVTSLRVKEIFCSPKLIVEGKVCKEALKLSRKELLEKNKASNFNLPVPKENTSGPLTIEFICWEHYLLLVIDCLTSISSCTDYWGKYY